MFSPRDVTIVVCTRERAGMLEGALGSIASTTPAETDVLVVDSASTTRATLAVADAAGVLAVRTDVKGLSIARNLGIAATDRPIIVYTDDDCLAVPGWIDALLAGFADGDVAAVTGRMLDHTLVGTSAPARRTTFTTVLGGLDAGHGALMAFRRDALVDVGGFDDVLGAGRHLAGAEDLDIFCRLIQAGHTLVHDERAVVHHVNTREDEAYTTLHRGYGLGLGALSVKWLRSRPLLGIALFATLVKRTGLRAVRNARDRRRGPADRAMLFGIFSGALAATRLRVVDGRFVDERPPLAVVLDDDRTSQGPGLPSGSTGTSR